LPEVRRLKMMNPEEVVLFVTPAKAGVQNIFLRRRHGGEMR
jgi:hypothetical protein